MSNKRIAFLHPDLGIGGAERAIVDAAIALQLKQFDITIFTNHHDTNHCFDETKNGELKVIVIGDFLPRSLFGRFCAFFAYFRLIFAALHIILFNFNTFDLIYVDQISAPVPLLKLFRFKVNSIRAVFLPNRSILIRSCFMRISPTCSCRHETPSGSDCTEFLLISWSDSLSRTPIRSSTTADSPVIVPERCHAVTTSIVQGSVFREHFEFLREAELAVLYPVPNIDNLSAPEVPLPSPIDNIGDALLFLSINRYEQKKNIDLALNAFGVCFVGSILMRECHRLSSCFLIG